MPVLLPYRTNRIEDDAGAPNAADSALPAVSCTVREDIAIGAARAEAGTLYEFLIESLTDHAVFALSESGRIVSWNVGAERTFGYTAAEVLERSFELIFTPEDVRAGEPGRELAAAMKGGHVEKGRWHVRNDGSRFWGTNTVATIKATDGSVIGFTKLVHDDTDARNVMNALSDSEEQLRLLVDSISEYAIVSLDVDGIIASWNPGARQLFGYREDDIVGTDFAALFLNLDRQAGIATRQLDAAATHGTADYEGWVVRDDGTQFFASSKLSRIHSGSSNTPRGYVLVAHDITERHFTAAGLQHRAFHDHLTNVPNRAAFYEHVQRAIAFRKRHASHVFAVLFVDLDNFKQINDVVGHNAADILLQGVARRLVGSVRDHDIIARIGGDEFAVLLDGVDGLADVQEIAERIGANMAAPLNAGEQTVKVSASVGIAMCHDKHAKPEDILADADLAMYAAKQRGRAKSVTFSSAMQAGATPKEHAELRAALDRNELALRYQPIVDLATRRPAGFEALIRWQHPQRGLIEPHDFLPLAQATDLIIDVDRWVLHQACAQLKQWQTAVHSTRPLHVNVNLSLKSFNHPGLVPTLNEVLRTTGIPAGSLHLEIPESSFLERSERTRTLLQDIRRLGIELHVDDFGTGYSTLAALQHMPVQGLKIDAMFVTSMNSRSGFEIVRTVATLAHHLGITAIAQGVRTEQQVRDLETFGCRFGQGFLFSEPLDAAAAFAYSERF